MSFLKKLFLFLFVCIFSLSAGFVFALEIHYPTIFGHSINNTSTAAEYFCYFFGLGIDLAAFIAVIITAFGGVYYLISYGRGKLTSEAKEWIKAGLMGLLIVVFAGLIAQTINPDLSTCKLNFLSLIIPGSTSPDPIPPNATTTTYEEVPIGTLTESLLTRTMDCYGFDQSGDPIDGNPATEDILEPTYLNHDRADCLTQLIDGAQKKSQIIAALSGKIKKLMDTCSCWDAKTSQSKCDPACDPTKGCVLSSTNTQSAPGKNDTDSCAGGCVGAACKQPPNTTDCCPAGVCLGPDQSGCSTDADCPNQETCDTSKKVKDRIEHGLIDVSIDISGGGGNCSTPTKTYNGLDEFRCDASVKQCSNIASVIEGAEGIKKTKWEELNLYQQLTYFKEEITPLLQAIQDDKDVLVQAKNKINSDETCYLAAPYVDLLKTYQGTDRNQHIILTQKTFVDPETKKPVDSSKYCTGFNYSNSSCLKKCNDLCPDTSPAAINLYKNCTNSANQEKCIEDAYNNRPCANASGSSAPSIFENCINSCQSDCLNVCSQRYPNKNTSSGEFCSGEYDFCETQCNNNSRCVLENADNCLFGAKDFISCSNQFTDQGNANYCINNAYLCKNGSDQYAGYQDCAELAQYPDCSSATNQQTCQSKTGCAWNNNKCSQDYSASFFYTDGNDYEKCYAPYSPPLKNSSCYNKENTNAACQELCPETVKCPTSSKCPDCPCDIISDPDNPKNPLTLNFSVPNQSASAIGQFITSSIEVPANYQMVGPQCNQYSYSDDPLTFYCEKTYCDANNNCGGWKTDPNIEGRNKTAIGGERVCTKEGPTGKGGEIPVGQTVDDALNWADALINKINTMSQDMRNLLGKMKTAGDAINTSPVQNYCKCDAQLATGAPICKSNCQFWQRQDKETKEWSRGCTFAPCKGDPCQQVKNYLGSVWAYAAKLTDDFMNFYADMIKELRSDILKKLTYSRQTTSGCSAVSYVYGSRSRILSCTRVEDEIIPPINGEKITFDGQTLDNYCYGKELGKVLDNPLDLTDNWFCCQEYIKNPTQ